MTYFNLCKLVGIHFPKSKKKQKLEEKEVELKVDEEKKVEFKVEEEKKVELKADEEKKVELQVEEMKVEE